MKLFIKRGRSGKVCNGGITGNKRLDVAIYKVVTVPLSQLTQPDRPL